MKRSRTIRKHVCVSETCVCSVSGGDPAAETEAGEGGEGEERAETQQRPSRRPGKHTDTHITPEHMLTVWEQMRPDTL